MIKIFIDKPYFFPSFSDLKVSDLPMFDKMRTTADDVQFIAWLIDCEATILYNLEHQEFEKLIFLAKNMLETPLICEQTINFLPLGEYPFGFYAEFIQKVNLYKSNLDLVPYSIAYLRPGCGFESRNTYWLEYANNLPANVGLFYHYKMMQELEELGQRFASLQGSEDEDGDEQRAGIEHLKRYGEYLTIFNLANGDVLKMKEIYNLSVNEVLTYICANKDFRTFNDELSKLKRIRNGLQ